MRLRIGKLREVIRDLPDTMAIEVDRGGAYNTAVIAYVGKSFGEDVLFISDEDLEKEQEETRTGDNSN